MEILYYLDRFPKLSESFVVNEIHELESRDHDVAVFALEDPGEEIAHDECDDLDATVRYADVPDGRFASISSEVVRPRMLRELPTGSWPDRCTRSLYRTKQCIDFLEELAFDVDVVHTHFATPTSYAGRCVASFFRVPFVVTTHSFDLYSEWNEKHRGSILRSADRIITISEYNRAFIDDTIAGEVPVDVVRAGVRPDKFEPSPGATVGRILTVARFVETKGLLYAVRAVSRAVEEFPQLEYHLVGSGEYESRLKSEIRELGLTDNVKVLGNVTDERLIAEYDRAQCFLLPCVVARSGHRDGLAMAGNRDGIPVVLMEAMAMETPPVSTSISGIPELITDGKDGLLVEPRDPRALAEALVALVDDPSKAAAFGKRARRTVMEDFDVETEVGKLESILEAECRSP